jgi:hypothetical protein
MGPTFHWKEADSDRCVLGWSTQNKTAAFDKRCFCSVAGAARMDAWLDNVELKLDNLLTQVKWDKAWLRSSDLVNRNSAAQQQRREDELRAKNARYQSVLYDSAHVPVAVTVRIEAQEKPSKVADHSNTCTASPASFSALALASQYQKYNIKGSSASLIHEGFIDEDPQVLLRFVFQASSFFFSCTLRCSAS